MMREVQQQGECARYEPRSPAEPRAVEQSSTPALTTHCNLRVQKMKKDGGCNEPCVARVTQQLRGNENGQKR